MAWQERRLRCRVFLSSMTGFLGLLSGLMVWWLVSAMARAAGCWLRCRGECRGFAQLREGSDDPPPGEYGSVRLGGCDAHACQHSQQDDRHRQDAAQTGNQMHQTKTLSPNTKRYLCRLPIQRSACQRQPCIKSQEPMAQASLLLDIPRFSPYHPVRKQHTTTAKAIEYGEAPPPAICKRTGPHP